MPAAAQAAAGDVVRRTVADRAVKDAAGVTWRPGGRLFSGGRTVSANPTPVSGSWRLYQQVRTGVRRIDVPLRRAGRYAVVLYLAEPGPAGGRRRVFDVRAEGRTVRRGVEVFRTAPQRPLHALFETVVRDRRLSLRLRARRSTPAVSAIEVRRLGPASMRPVRELWSDDFEGPAGALPDAGLWTRDTGATFAFNEQQVHTDRPENASLDGQGALRIVARRERYEMEGVTRDFTSARLVGNRRVPLRRAEVQIRARFPLGVGIWSVLFLYGQGATYPFGGEVDIAEINGGLPERLHHFLHFGRMTKDGPTDSVLDGSLQLGERVDARRRTYVLRSVPGAMEVLVDGRRTASWTRADLYGRRARWAFDGSFELLMSLAVGGRFTGPAGPDTPFPAVMEIDRVLVRG